MSKIEEALEKATKAREAQQGKSHNTENTQCKRRPVSFGKSSKTLSVLSLVILIGVLTGGFFYYLIVKGKTIKNSTVASKLTTSIEDNRRTEKTMTLKGSAYKVEVTRLTEDILKNMPGSARISYTDLSGNEFYAISIKAINDCISEDNAKSIYNDVSIIKDGTHIKPNALTALNDMKTVVYKRKACKGKPGIVYLRFCMAWQKEINPAGLLIDGKEILF